MAHIMGLLSIMLGCVCIMVLFNNYYISLGVWFIFSAFYTILYEIKTSINKTNCILLPTSDAS